MAGSIETRLNWIHTGTKWEKISLNNITFRNLLYTYKIYFKGISMLVIGKRSKRRVAGSEKLV